MDKKEREEKQLIKWERAAAKQMKNTFADIKEIKFDKDSINKNKLTGYTTVTVKIYTTENNSEISLSLPVDKNEEKLSNYGYGYGGKEPKEGETTNKIEVIYSNEKKEVL